jgi:hypothetical protein
MAAFLFDKFTDTAGVTLTSHTPDVGTSWAKSTTYSAGEVIISDANRARSNNSNVVGYLGAGTPASPDYAVAGKISVKSVPSPDGYIGLAARMVSATGTMYMANYDVADGKWHVYSFNGTTTPELGGQESTPSTGYAQTLTPAVDYWARSEVHRHGIQALYRRCIADQRHRRDRTVHGQQGRLHRLSQHEQLDRLPYRHADRGRFRDDRIEHASACREFERQYRRAQGSRHEVAYVNADDQRRDDGQWRIDHRSVDRQRHADHAHGHGGHSGPAHVHRSDARDQGAGGRRNELQRDGGRQSEHF